MKHAAPVLVSGRAGLTDGTCPLHGPAEDGSPCARFAHLDPTGRGLARRPLRTRVAAGVRGLVKPVVLIGGLGGVFWFAWQTLPGLFTGLPGVTP